MNHLTPAQIAERDQVVEGMRDWLDGLVDRYRPLAAEVGREQAISELAALVRSHDPVLAACIVAVAVDRLAQREPR